MTWEPQLTKDGSYTFFSKTFNETFHSSQGARAEAFTKFAIATDLPELAQQPKLKILDVCYGLGYNTAAALETIWQVNPNCQVDLYGLENDATVPQAALAPQLIDHWSAPVQQALRALVDPDNAEMSANLTGGLLIGDARQTIKLLIDQGFQAQAIFFDPFSPRRCPQLWTVEFFQEVARCLAIPGKLTTYSRSASVRAAMLEAELTIGTLPLAEPDPNYPHEWSQGTVAIRGGTLAETGLVPLSQMEQEHLQTRAGVAFRDPTLVDEAEVILARQEKEKMVSDRESTSSWRRRWGLG